MSGPRRLLLAAILMGTTGADAAYGQANGPLTPPFNVPPSVRPSKPLPGKPSPPQGPTRPDPGGPNGPICPTVPFYPAWGWGGGFWAYPPTPLIFTPPPSGVWRMGYDGRPYYDLVTTPVLLGTPFGYPSMPLAEQSVLTPVEEIPAPAAPAPAAAPARREPIAISPRDRTRDAARCRELTELGDRLFRGDKASHAAKRYEQAMRADPGQAEPRARMALVALSRGEYAEAANRLREAEAAEPGWLSTAGDVQRLYREPADFAAAIARLESHLQARPEDRDAWLVLGSLWYLSGRTQKAADVFLRLSDRLEDPTLLAFLRATKAQ